MKKVIQVIKPVIQGFVLCAVALQIVLGVIYIGSNFMAVPQFRDTTIYLEMAEHFVADEYTGILYPLFVKLCLGISIVPYQILIYLIQIIVGLFCVYHFVCTWTDRKLLALLCALWINTIPFVAQAHVTVLPHSLAFSFLLLMLLEVLKGTVYRKPLSIADWAVLLCSYTILAQLTQGYLLAGTLLVGWAVCLQLYAQAQKVLWFLVCMLICTGIFVSNLAVFHITQTPGYYGRMQRSLEARFFQRAGVATLSGKFLVYMPEEIQACFTASELDWLNKYPYQIETEFGPTLEARYGKEYADKLYWELGMLGLKTATKATLLDIAEDTIGYAMPLGYYATWQDGELKGATSWNYQQFIEETPELATAYAKICHFLWMSGFAVSVTVCFVAACGNKKFYLNIWVPVLLYVIAYALYFALGGAGTYDYKLSLLPMVLSYAPMCCLFIRYIF